MPNHKINLLLICIILVLIKFGTTIAVGNPVVPCYFIFGDSLVDSGNNNELKTAAKADYPPYGIDFPNGATGRFTNGRTMADIIGELLNFNEYTPTYAVVTDQKISKGVNYASGAAGIRDETGIHLGDRISLERQLYNHYTIISRLFKIQRNKTFTNRYLRKCIYVVNIGSNDYINNYLKPTFYTTSHMYTTNKYAKVLIRQYSKQLKKLYNLGGRKIVVFGLGPIGCTPAEISNFGTDGESCVESINDAVKQFNENLKNLVDELNFDNVDAKFTFINLTSITLQGQGLGLSNGPCCQVIRADGLCTKNTDICPVRALSIYYDGFHPTDIANSIIATTSFNAVSPMDASPYDISHLIRL